MNKPLFFCILLLVPALLTFCTSREGEDEISKPNVPETPKALREDQREVKISSRTKGDDLIQELYQEMVDTSLVLRKLEEDLNGLETHLADLRTRANNYSDKSDHYYHAADSRIFALRDSLLKNRISMLISESRAKYLVKTSTLHSLLKRMSEKDLAIQDHHLVMKVILTLPLIEKYQNDHLPDASEFKNRISEQDHLIRRMDSLTPAY